MVTDAGSGDAWPTIHDQLLQSEILINATPTWLGRPSSVAQRVLERMDAMMSETDDDERPVAYTVPGQAWTYWHLGPGPGPDYLEEQRGHDWAHSTGRTMAENLSASPEPCPSCP